MYTYEDLKKAPVGTKITFESEETLYKISDKKDGFKGSRFYRDIEDLEELRDNIGCFTGKIIKIEEPNYTTVYEVKDILDEKEKEYLSNIIKPFKDKIMCISKYNYTTKDKNLEQIWIVFNINTNEYHCMFLPPFKKRTMYKGMEVDRKYSLEELDL